MTISMQEYLARRPRREAREHLSVAQRVIELEGDADMLEFEHLAMEAKIDRMTAWAIKMAIAFGTAAIGLAGNIVLLIYKSA